VGRTLAGGSHGLMLPQVPNAGHGAPGRVSRAARVFAELVDLLACC